MYDLVLMTGSFPTELSAAGCAVVCAVPCAEALTVTRAGSRTASSLREYFITISSLSVAEPDHYTRRFIAPSAASRSRYTRGPANAGHPVRTPNRERGRPARRAGDARDPRVRVGHGRKGEADSMGFIEYHL